MLIHSVIKHDIQMHYFQTALKTKLVSARMDQNQCKVFVTSRVHRTFGRNQWQALHDTLTGWKLQLGMVKESMQAIVSAPIVPAK